MAKARQILEGRGATLGALCTASAVVVVLGAVAVDAGLLATSIALLHVAALSGVAFAWARANEASKAAQKASADLRYVAKRLIRLEQDIIRTPGAATPAIRTTMAEVTGTVGLLGGVVRELARNVAAQNRDVADLKDSLKVSTKPAESEKPALKIAPEPRPVTTPVAAREKAQPEPSLLPQPRKETEDEMRRMRLVTQAFEADRVELHLQPVVALPQRRVRFYEALARLRLADGTLLGPGEFLPVLERLGRAPEFDRRVITRTIAVANHLLARGSEAIVGVNLSPRSVREPGFLHSLVRVLDASPEVVGKIVLELPQSLWRSLDADQRQALATLRDRGVPMSLDRAGDLDFDARALSDLGVRFLKLPAELMLAAAEQDEGSAYDLGVRDFASILRREGIKLVAERVEREEIVPALVDLGVPLAQGFVFAAPRAIRSEVLGEPGAEKASSPAGDRPAMRRAG
ncbi:EAL domain-containing protein [Microvirga alba]|uniref:EAL domain-containing protein n=1 Tax=Microvirga alba TaxID=2791025 RepID=A0A931FRV3_9HYPH|nr:EAL domain-containing protein [Microvirga alba]MBF9234938.1 EAL domain-containing protein [Microvirga alba]